MSDLRASLAELETLAGLQYEISREFHYDRVDCNCLRDGLITMLGGGFPQELTAGALGYLQSEIWQRFYARFLDPTSTLEVLRKLLTDALQKKVHCHITELEGRLGGLVAASPKEDAAYKILATLKPQGRSYSAWLRELAWANGRWDNSELKYPASLSALLKNYAGQRKGLVYESRRQLLNLGFVPESPHLQLLGAKALEASSLYARAFSLWEHLDRTSREQSKANTT